MLRSQTFWNAYSNLQATIEELNETQKGFENTGVSGKYSIS